MTLALSWRNFTPTRGSAFTIHLALSLLVFSTLVAFMLVYWFPGDLFIMDGGWEGLKLVALVDLVLGPALTLILFKPGKPGLIKDLSIIASVQIAALAYGFYTTYNLRTVAVVFADANFATISAKDKKLADEALAKFDIQPRTLPSAKPFAIPQFMTPAAPAFDKYLENVLNGYPAAQFRNDQYVALEGQQDALRRYARTATHLENNDALEAVNKAVKKLNMTLDEVEIYDFRARFGGGYALFDPATARVIDFVSHKGTEDEALSADNGQ